MIKQTNKRFTWLCGKDFEPRLSPSGKWISWQEVDYEESLLNEGVRYSAKITTIRKAYHSKKKCGCVPWCGYYVLRNFGLGGYPKTSLERTEFTQFRAIVRQVFRYLKVPLNE